METRNKIVIGRDPRLRRTNPTSNIYTIRQGSNGPPGSLTSHQNSGGECKRSWSRNGQHKNVEENYSAQHHLKTNQNGRCNQQSDQVQNFQTSTSDRNDANVNAETNQPFNYMDCNSPANHFAGPKYPFSSTPINDEYTSPTRLTRSFSRADQSECLDNSWSSHSNSGSPLRAQYRSAPNESVRSFSGPERSNERSGRNHVRGQQNNSMKNRSSTPERNETCNDGWDSLDRDLKRSSSKNAENVRLSKSFSGQRPTERNRDRNSRRRRRRSSGSFSSSRLDRENARGSREIRDRSIETRDRSNGAQDHLNRMQDHSNGTRDRSVETRDRLNRTQDHSNGARDRLNRTRDRSIEARDCSNGARDRLNRTQDRSIETRDRSNGAQDRLNRMQDHSNGTQDRSVETRDRFNRTRDHSNGARDRLNRTPDHSSGQSNGNQFHMKRIDRNEQSGRETRRSKSLRGSRHNDRSRSNENDRRYDRQEEISNQSQKRSVDNFYAKTPSKKSKHNFDQQSTISEIIQLKTVIGRRNREISSLKRNESKLENNLCQASEDIKKLENENRHLKESQNGRTVENSKQASQSNQTIINDFAKMKFLQNEIDRLNQVIECQNQQSDKLKKTLEENTRLSRSKIKTLEDLNTQLQVNVTKIEFKNDLGNRKEKDYKDTIKKLEFKLFMSDQVNQVHESKNESHDNSSQLKLKEEKQKLENEIVELKSQLENKIKNFDVEKANLEEKCISLQQQIQVKSEKNDYLVEEDKRKLKMLTDAEEFTEILRSKLQRSEYLLSQSTNGKIVQDVEEANSKLIEKSNECRTLNDEKKSLAKSNEKLKHLLKCQPDTSSNEKIEKLQAENQKLKLQLETKESEVKRSKETIQFLKENIEQQETQYLSAKREVESKIVGLESKVLSLEQKISEKDLGILDKSSTVSALIIQIENLKKGSRKLAKDHEASSASQKEEIGRLQGLLSTANERLDVLERQKQEKDEMIATLKQSIEEKDNRIEELKSRKRSLVGSLKQKIEENDKLEEESKSLAARNTILTKKVKLLENLIENDETPKLRRKSTDTEKTAKLGQELEKSKKLVEKLNRSNTSMSTKNDELMKKMKENFQAKCSKQETQIKNLKDSLSDKQNNLQMKKSRLRNLTESKAKLDEKVQKVKRDTEKTKKIVHASKKK